MAEVNWKSPAEWFSLIGLSFFALGGVVLLLLFLEELWNALSPLLP